MIWPTFTQNQLIIRTMVVAETHIFLIRPEVWNKFISQLDSKEPFTTTSDNTLDWIIMAKEENLILLPKRRKMMFFLRVKITGQEGIIEKEITFINIKIHLMPDWADQNYFKKRNFRKQVRDSSKTPPLTTKWCIKAFSPRNSHQWLRSSRADPLWRLSPLSMIELYTICRVLLRSITENTTKLKNLRIIIKLSRLNIEKIKINFLTLKK